MDIHEYQAKTLFRRDGIKTLKGEVADSPEQALHIARNIGGKAWVLKSQVHAGGRGMAGGVKIARSFEQVQMYAKALIGKKLITSQTGKDGKIVHQILIEQIAEIKKEFYLALLLDREKEAFNILASSTGGVSIEEQAQKNPNMIFRSLVHPVLGCFPFQTLNLLKFFKLPFEFFKVLDDLIKKLYQIMIKKEATLIEINPLALVVQDKKDTLVPLDAKISIDDNALFRQEDMKALRDFREIPLSEQKALAHDLSFVQLKGPIGCLVNGAGLAMATMDIVQLKGGKPANFLDVGGGVNAEKIDIAFRILKEDPKVKGILVNIFGGIVRCDLIAEGLIRAIKNLKITFPIVVRLEGTRAKVARSVLDNSGLDLHFADDLTQAAEKIVSLTS